VVNTNIAAIPKQGGPTAAASRSAHTRRPAGRRSSTRSRRETSQERRSLRARPVRASSRGSRDVQPRGALRSRAWLPRAQRRCRGRPTYASSSSGRSSACPPRPSPPGSSRSSTAQGRLLARPSGRTRTHGPAVVSRRRAACGRGARRSRRQATPAGRRRPRAAGRDQRRADAHRPRPGRRPGRARDARLRRRAGPGGAADRARLGGRAGDHPCRRRCSGVPPRPGAGRVLLGDLGPLRGTADGRDPARRGIRGPRQDGDPGPCPRPRRRRVRLPPLHRPRQLGWARPVGPRGPRTAPVRGRAFRRPAPGSRRRRHDRDRRRGGPDRRAARPGGRDAAGTGTTLLVGGLAVGLLALAADALGADPTDVLFSGQSSIPDLVVEDSASVVLVVLAAKGLAYAVCLGCGFRGGPSSRPSSSGSGSPRSR
jgi:hypothetical protein